MISRFLKKVPEFSQANLTLTTAATMSSKVNPNLLRKQLEQYTPVPQPYITFEDAAWKSIDPSQQPPKAPTPDSPANPPSPTAITNLRLFTWNIDFQAPSPQARMATALSHLATLVASTPHTTAVIICLQELQQDILTSSTDDDDTFTASEAAARHPTSPDADDLGQLAAAPWVRARFAASDLLTTRHWRVPYNVVTLVDRRLAISRVARMPFVSEFGREALLVDIALWHSGTVAGDGGGGASTKAAVLRVCNVHLDSMGDRSRLRAIQWKACAKYLQDYEGGGVVAAVLAGDCNANNVEDETAPMENGFRDAYLELGGEEGDPEGHTWGPQSRGTRFPHRRMDKVCFWQREEAGEAGAQKPLELKGLEKIGEGLRVEDEAASRELIEERGLDYVSDHYGLMADFEVGEGWAVASEKS